MREPVLVHDRRRFVLPSTVTLTLSVDEAVLLNLADETMFSLNATGARVAALIVDGLDVETIVERLSEEYGAARKELLADVSALIEALVGAGLIVLSSAGHA